MAEALARTKLPLPGSNKNERTGHPIWDNPVLKKASVVQGLTNLGAAAQAGAFIHGKHAGGDIAHNVGLGAEVAAVALDVAIYATVDMHLAGVDIALDVGHLADGHLAGVGLDFTLDVAIDVHIVLETDGTDNLDTGGKNVGRVCAHVCMKG